MCTSVPFASLANVWPYLGSEAAELHGALDGEEDGEDEVAVGQQVGVVEGGAVELQWQRTLFILILGLIDGFDKCSYRVTWLVEYICLETNF